VPEDRRHDEPEVQQEAGDEQRMASRAQHRAQSRGEPDRRDHHAERERVDPVAVAGERGRQHEAAHRRQLQPGEHAEDERYRCDEAVQ
jgi:hypothetical protein